ncbi:unnamed protein product [Notodromas monacha]|uniref:Adenine phosphoribosyltransferase n=1 Tax=Notodromas monacha TaxID=399045 RepID=A0A7R9G9C4_9CRUS|nr:unnamed protein product [Notodromas monacha]CAG0913057.1 unnamed protein product [Notodromas monacha]
MSNHSELMKFVKEYPDFPKPGITFRDVFPMFSDPQALQSLVDACVDIVSRGSRPDVILGVESRGFLLAPLIAYKLGIGFAPVRKVGKLPGRTACESYDLEYGQDSIEVQVDSFKPGQNVVVLDDLIATGGTLSATCKLAKKLGANVISCLTIVELKDLGGRAKIDAPVFSLITY